MLAKFSVKKPLTIIIAVLLVMLLGVISYTSMTADLLPDMDLPYVVVMTTYPGASPEKVELAVTKPMEQVLATTSGVKEINSVSQENASMVILEFEQGTNMDSAMIEMSGNIDLVKAQLDDAVGAPMLMKMNPDMLPVMVAAVDVSGMDIKQSSALVQEEIIPRFERIDGVASVSAMGLVENRANVTLDQGKIDELNRRVLASVDEKLAETQAQLDQARDEIARGKAELAAQSKNQTGQLAGAGTQVSDGRAELKDQLEALRQQQKDMQEQLPQITGQLEVLAPQLAQLEQGIAQMEEMVAGLEAQHLPVPDELTAKLKEAKEQLPTLKGTVEQLQQAKAQIEQALPQVEAGIAQMETALKDLDGKQTQIESGKMTMSQELAKAAAQLQVAEMELEKQQREFENARDEAYKKAGLEGIITRDTIAQLLAAQNFEMPAGTIDEGEAAIPVKVGDAITNPAALGELVLFHIDAGDIGDIRLQDVAAVETADNADEMYAKINGNDGVLLTFQKQSVASTVTVSDKLNQAMADISAENGDVRLTVLQDQGVYIHIVIDSVLQNLLFGGLLAVLILWLFLRDIKPTFIVALSIPISLLFAVALMYFTGVTMNIISLAGLALGVGMLVDNSIVAIENIYRLRAGGMRAAEAAVKGAAQVAGALAASTLTTVCVFLPIVFTQGISRQLFTDMGLTIAYSLVASLIVALTLVPTLASKTLRKPPKATHKWFDAFVRGYEKLLSGALKHRAIVLTAVVLLLALSAWGVLGMGTAFMPETDGNQISVSLGMDEETTRDEARQMASTATERLLKIEGVDTVGAMQGGSGTIMGGGGGNDVSLYVILKKDRSATSAEIAQQIYEETGDIGCEVRVSSSQMDISALAGSGLQVDIEGQDMDQLQRIAKDVAGIVSGVEGTRAVSDGLENASDDIRISVDKGKATGYGLSVAQVYQQVSAALKNEVRATTIAAEAGDYPVIVIDSAGSAPARDTLGDLLITGTRDGQEEKVALRDIASIDTKQSPTSIRRDNQKRTLRVTAEIDEDHNIGLVSRDLEKALAAYQAPAGYTVALRGESETINETLGELIKMVLLAIVFIYMIMVAQFQSFKDPFIVMFTIPLAFTGGLLALLATRMELSMIAMLGFLMLSGVIVNNGIVFVDYVNQLRRAGMEKREALLATGKTRLRPILMTALTTILGLSTLAFGMGTGAEMLQPMAVVTIGGLAYATIMTLFVVPIMYDMMHKKPMKNAAVEEDEPDAARVQ
nr:efflux RND transporter permease subunit [Maliibacterium massiliense]